MIQELVLLTIGYLTAYFVKQRKIVCITKQKQAELNIAAAEAQEMQREFNEKGGNPELTEKQIENLKTLERHIAYREILKEFNYFIW